MRKNKTKPRVHPINTIGLIQRAVLKDCLLFSDDMTTLVNVMNLDHHKVRGDIRYSQKNLLPHLVKIVRKKHKWHEVIREWRSFKEYMRVYKLNNIRNYKDITEAIKLAPSVIQLPLTKQEKDHLKLVQQRLKEKESKKNEW